MSGANERAGAADAMICRACGREERASEGYPCAECGTFICLICNFRGTVRCRECEARAGSGGEPKGAAGGPAGGA